MPGGPFLFGALLAFIALLITISLPDSHPSHKKSNIKKKTDSDIEDGDSGYPAHQDNTPLLLQDSLAWAHCTSRAKRVCVRLCENHMTIESSVDIYDVYSRLDRFLTALSQLAEFYMNSFLIRIWAS